jgi:hypothetical protein
MVSPVPRDLRIAAFGAGFFPFAIMRVCFFFDLFAIRNLSGIIVG